MDKVSVIIRCRNEAQWIGHAIQSCIDKLHKPEIVVVDNNSTDESMSIVNMFKKDDNLNNGGNYTKIDTYKINNYSPGKSLNFAVEKCSNENILILSAHSQIMSLDLDKIISKLEDNITVWGKQIPIYKGKKITPRYVWSNFKDYDMHNYFCEYEDRYFLHNAFCFYKKDTLIKYPFDEQLAGKEDRYWINDRIKEGYKSFYDNSMICNHHYTTNGATWKGVG